MLSTQGNAKEQYCLTDTDLKKLGSLTKSNPQKKEWSAMKLYLVEQASAASYLATHVTYSKDVLMSPYGVGRAGG